MLLTLLSIGVSEVSGPCLHLGEVEAADDHWHFNTQTKWFYENIPCCWSHFQDIYQ